MGELRFNGMRRSDPLRVDLPEWMARNEVAGALVVRTQEHKAAVNVADTNVEPAQETLSDAAYRKIKAAIIHGELAPGLQAAEQQIAQRLQVSRTPVHQAIVRLEQEGWVRLLPKKGVVIDDVNSTEMRHIYEVLMGLESIAAERLASRPLEDESGIDAEIQSVAGEAEAALAAKDLDAWAEADDRFHRLLVERSGNPHLVRLARSVMEKSHRARLITLSGRPWPEQSNKDHKEIVDAILRRDPAAAREALSAHRRRGMAVLLPVIERIQEKARILSP